MTLLLLLVGCGLLSGGLALYGYLWRRRYGGRVLAPMTRVRGRVAAVVPDAGRELQIELVPDGQQRCLVRLDCRVTPARPPSPGDRVTVTAVPAERRVDRLYREASSQAFLDAVQVVRGTWPELRMWWIPAIIAVASIAAASLRGYPASRTPRHVPWLRCPPGTVAQHDPSSDGRTEQWCSVTLGTNWAAFASTGLTRKEGPWGVWTDKSRRLAYGQYDMGDREGEFVEWDLAGRKRRSAHYRGDRLHGLVTSYYPNGAVEHQFSYERGVPHGRWTSWSSQARLLFDRSFWKGLPQGPVRVADQGGTLLEEGTMWAGRRLGRWTTTKAGRPSEQRHFLFGWILDGRAGSRTGELRIWADVLKRKLERAAAASSIDQSTPFGGPGRPATSLGLTDARGFQGVWWDHEDRSTEVIYRDGVPIAGCPSLGRRALTDDEAREWWPGVLRKGERSFEDSCRLLDAPAGQARPGWWNELRCLPVRALTDLGHLACALPDMDNPWFDSRERCDHLANLGTGKGGMLRTVISGPGLSLTPTTWNLWRSQLARGFAAALREGSPAERGLKLRVDLDSEGRVARVRLDGERNEGALERRVMSIVRSWRFQAPEGRSLQLQIQLSVQRHPQGL